MVSARMRPRFQVEVPGTPDDLRQVLVVGLEEHGCPVGGQSVKGHVDLWICERNRHTWSPWLHLELRSGGSGTLVAGRFGPDPHVWTGFMALYAVFAFALVMGVMFGFAQMAAGEAASGFLGAGASVAALALVYVAALTGQALGHDQMDTLKDWFDARLAARAED